jgi:hypothetical protein
MKIPGAFLNYFLKEKKSYVFVTMGDFLIAVLHLIAVLRLYDAIAFVYDDDLLTYDNTAVISKSG